MKGLAVCPVEMLFNMPIFFFSRDASVTLKIF